MTRIIRIESCATCPSRDHAGAFGKVSCVPVCSLMRRRELPHSVERGFGSRLVAVPTNAIPDWCPLEFLPVLSQTTPQHTAAVSNDSEGGLT